jgi:hypothetical protein
MLAEDNKIRGPKTQLLSVTAGLSRMRESIAPSEQRGEHPAHDLTRSGEPLKQVAKSFGGSYDKFFRAYKDGQIKVIWIGRRIFVPREEIQRLEREGLPRIRANDK